MSTGTAATSVGRVALSTDKPHGGLGIWERGGLTVTGLHREFADPAWLHRGQHRALKQFIMNWNNWPSFADRAAMLDGPPHKRMPRDRKARIAAVVHCLCERDHHPLPKWARRFRVSGRSGGVMLLSDTPFSRNGASAPSRFEVIIRDKTPSAAQRYRVWFDPSILDAR